MIPLWEMFAFTIIVSGKIQTAAACSFWLRFVVVKCQTFSSQKSMANAGSLQYLY